MRILLIEDESGLVRTLSDLLARRGYSVESRLTGEDGLQAALAEAFDLVILDVMLPGMDGFEVCRRLRETDVRMPVLMLTARGETHDKVNGFEGGADDYVTKPFDPDELLARVAALIRRSAIGSVSDLRGFEFGGYRIDFVRSQLIRDGKAIDLSERESRLLRYFVEHRNEIVTRETLLQEVWGYQAVPYTRTVDVHIVWLRQKVEEDPRNPRYILTVHGQGYRFSV